MAAKKKPDQHSPREQHSAAEQVMTYTDEVDAKQAKRLKVRDGEIKKSLAKTEAENKAAEAARQADKKKFAKRRAELEAEQVHHNAEADAEARKNEQVVPLTPAEEKALKGKKKPEKSDRKPMSKEALAKAFVKLAADEDASRLAFENHQAAQKNPAAA